MREYEDKGKIKMIKIEENMEWSDKINGVNEGI